MTLLKGHQWHSQRHSEANEAPGTGSLLSAASLQRQLAQQTPTRRWAPLGGADQAQQTPTGRLTPQRGAYQAQTAQTAQALGAEAEQAPQWPSTPSGRPVRLTARREAAQAPLPYAVEGRAEPSKPSTFLFSLSTGLYAS